MSTEQAEGGGASGGEQQQSNGGGAENQNQQQQNNGGGEQQQQQNNNDQQQQQQNDQQQQQQQTKEFKVPDAFKDKPWASKIKSEDDLYKQIDTLDALKGKKYVVPGADTPAEEVDKYFDGLKPQEISAYEIGDDIQDKELIGKMMQDANLHPHQAKKLLPAYLAYEKNLLEQATSADGFKAEMVKSFGEKYDAQSQAVVNELKQHLSAEDKKVIDTIPNAYLGIVYRLVNKMQQAYGAQENGDAHTAKSGQQVQVDMVKERSDLRKQIAELDNRPHTAQEKQDLINKLQATYDSERKK